MSERFTERLRQESQPVWSQATEHRFVRELLSGTVPDAMRAFFDSADED